MTYNNHIETELWQTAVSLRGTVAPADYKHFVLWFLSKNRSGTHGYRARREEVLFIDARPLGEMLNRRQRQLTGAEIKRIATAYHAFRNPGAATPDLPGFSKVATLAEIRGHDYKLTPGIYVGTEAGEDDGEAFEEKMPRLIEELRSLFAESDRLQAEILRDLEALGETTSN